MALSRPTRGTYKHVHFGLIKSYHLLISFQSGLYQLTLLFIIKFVTLRRRPFFYYERYFKTKKNMNEGECWMSVALLLSKADCSSKRALIKIPKANCDWIGCFCLDNTWRVELASPRATALPPPPNYKPTKHHQPTQPTPASLSCLSSPNVNLLPQSFISPYGRQQKLTGSWFWLWNHLTSLQPL